jgi:GxxExxY protein
MKNQEMTSVILKFFYKVCNTLGFGFLEKVYENSLYYELINNGLLCQKQVPTT